MIVIEHLTKRYGAMTAVDDLSLSVPAGELFCFLGPNGAGKTTTIKVLTGLLHPTAGRALIAGHDVRREPIAAKALIGYIPDMPYVYDRLTAAEFFEFTGDLYGLAPETIRARRGDLFDLFGLADQAGALVRELSHGYRQRLLYAAAFLHEPRVLFIDEPLIGLDPYTIRLIKDLLIRKARAGMTIFLTTHILALAEDVADRIGIIHGGRLVTLGTLPELLARHAAEDLEQLFLTLTATAERPAVNAAGNAAGGAA